MDLMQFTVDVDVDVLTQVLVIHQPQRLYVWLMNTGCPEMERFRHPDV